jgi:hypothetical protein
MQIDFAEISKPFTNMEMTIWEGKKDPEDLHPQDKK